MGTKCIAIAVAGLILTFAFAARSNAGSDMIIDNSAQAPPPVYNYAPPPPRVYYLPPPVSVVVYPGYRYYDSVRVYGYHRRDVRRIHRPLHPWR